MKDCPKIELGQLTTTINGLWTGKKPPFKTVAVIRNTNFSKDCRLKMDDVAMIDVEERQFATRKLQVGDIIIEKSGGSDKQPVGRPVIFNISGGEYSFSNFTSTLRVLDKSVVLPEYLHKFLYNIYLTGKIAEMQSKTTGLRNLDFNAYKKILIPVPSIEEQQRIVDELDLLTGIIDKKQAQLRDLDALSKSIFYEMFGDPVINEKGWTIEKLSSVSTLLNGRAYKQDELLEHGKYKVLRVGNFFTNSNYYYSDLELEDDKYCSNGDLLFAWSASFGAFIWSGEKVIYHYHIWKVIYDEHRLNKLFYQYLLNMMTSSFKKDIHGIGMVHLTKAGMEQYELPLPPLSLQEIFCERVTDIGKQKKEIMSSLEDVQSVFNGRMTFYFG